MEKAQLLEKHGSKTIQKRNQLVSRNLAQKLPSGLAKRAAALYPAPRHYYEKIFKPAIEKTGLHAVRADAEIFATGKIIDQVWRGINAAKVLVAELTTRNANVFYELGLAHALNKPVVLVSSNESDVPFDLQHIRVIYYDVSDPFWGNKLIEKVAENILSALKNPEEAIFKSAIEAEG